MVLFLTFVICLWQLNFLHPSPERESERERGGGGGGVYRVVGRQRSGVEEMERGRKEGEGELEKLYRTAPLLRPARCYAPPPLFSGEITVKGYYTSITRPPPPPRGPLEPVCRTAVLHVYACCKCRSVVFVYQACRK